MPESNDYYKSVDEIEAVVRGFESCTTKPSEFDHRAHLTVAFAYLHLSQLSVEAARVRMRAGLYRFLDHNHVDRLKYNETITLFWIKLVRSFLDRTDTKRSVSDIANEMITTYSNSQLIFDYYSKGILSSEEARETWVEPDVKPLNY
ncbi:MAG TPA: hypothetical protein VKB86_11860 [Pyrinomonadaceae bacterium]|nr:hypothetical protein [Pyrinomonadaceae bacterium]